MPPLFQDFIALKASLFLVVPYVHVLGLVLAHVAVITLSDAPIAGYNLTFFSRYLLLLLLVFCIFFAIILGGYLLICYYSYYYHYLFIYLNHSVLCNSLCTASFEH